MLQSMRHLAHSWIFKGLMAFLILSFGIWGIGDIFRGNPLQRTVAKVGDQTITVQDVTLEFQRELSYARSNYLPDLTADAAIKMGLLNKSVDALIERSLRDRAVHDYGITISLHTALKQLADDPAFKTKDGQFDRGRFDQFLKEGRFTERQLLAGTAHDLLQSSVTSMPTVPELISKNLYKAQGQKRIMEIVDIAPTALSTLTPPEDAIKAYYDSNPNLFTRPELRTLTVANLNIEDIATDIIITDEQLKAAYDDNRTDLTQPEKRDLIQAIVQDENKAISLANKAAAQGNLYVAAKEMGLNTVTLDKVEQLTLPTELAAPVFSMGAQTISPVIKSSLGWHVVEVTKIHPAYKPELKVLATELRKKMQTDRATDMIGTIINKLDDKLAAGTSLESIAHDIKLSIQTIDSLDNTGLQDGRLRPLENHPNKSGILDFGFRQQSGETSSIIDDRAGHYTIVRTDSVTPSARPPFDNVRDLIITAIKTDNQRKEGKARANDIAAAMKGGRQAATLAAEKGISVRFSKPLAEIGATDETLPSDILGQALTLKQGETLITEKDNHHLVLRLASIKEVGDSKEERETMGQLATHITISAHSEALAQFMTYLRRQYNVQIDHDALASVGQTETR